MTREEAVDRVLACAAKYLGMREQPKGSNKGEILIFGGKGGPWCAAFVNFVYHEATGQDPTSAGFCRGTLRMLAAAKRDGLVRPKGEPPQRGDIFVLSRGPGHGHTGFVESVTCDSHGPRMQTIEGNSGNQVARRTRFTTARVLGFIRPGAAPAAEGGEGWET